MSLKDYNISDDEFNQSDKLQEVLGKILQTLESGQDDIYNIADDCHQQCRVLAAQVEKINLEVIQIIKGVELAEKADRYSRVKLVDVSRNFKSFTEEDLKAAYENAQKNQLDLFALRQSEKQLREKREDMTRELKRFEKIAQRADGYLQNTSLALKILKGNVEKISEGMEGAKRKQQMGLWIIQSQESERRKLARDLHDGPAQTMASILLRLDLLEHFKEKDSSQLKEEIDSIKQMSRENLSEIRRMMHDLKPSLFNESGLISTLTDYFNDYEVKYNFNIEFLIFGSPQKYDISLEIALFRIVQEAISNVRKHAGVDTVKVKFEDQGDKINLLIKDQGKGFNWDKLKEEKKESYGIMGMRERVELLGGTMEVNSTVGKGTQVIIELPIEGERMHG